MSKTYSEQFKEALACETKEQADQWFTAEVKLYETEHGIAAEEAITTIRANLGYMAGYHDHAAAKKMFDLFGAIHPVFKSWNYHNTLSPEAMLQIGIDLGKKTSTKP
jgi:hypothetical protein